VGRHGAAAAAQPELVDAHTSIKQRIEHVQEQGRAEDLKTAQVGVAGSTAAAALEEGLWLCAVEDRRRLDSAREGMIAGFSLGNYLLLVEHTGRLLREGKVAISAELAGIFERLGSNAENRHARLHKLADGRLLGRFFAASRALLRDTATRLGVHHPANLGRLPGTLTRRSSETTTTAESCDRRSHDVRQLVSSHSLIMSALGAGRPRRCYQQPDRR
jgi:hypothetical protein